MSVRWVLVDGYSVLHAWPRFQTKSSRRTSLQQRREILLRLLQQYADQSGRRVTVVFDAYAAKHPSAAEIPTAGFEVLFSKKGQSADELIERLVAGAAHRAQILVVTSDHLERSLVEGFGAQSISAENFEAEAQAGLEELASLVRHHGRRPRGLGHHWPGSPRRS